MWRWLALALLSACAQPSPWVHSGRKLRARPVRVVIAPNLEPCAGAFFDALASWRNEGVSATLEVAEGWEPWLFGTPVSGVVAFTVRRLNPGELGRTERALTVLGDILYAHVELAPGECRPVILAHELGHALGLVDLYEVPGNLMCWNVECQQAQPDQTPTLSPDQRAWVRD